MPKVNTAEPVAGQVSGTVVQPCAARGLLVVTLEYLDLDSGRPTPDRACSVRIRSADGQTVRLEVHTHFTKVSHLLDVEGCYTVEIESPDWKAPINVVYRGNVRKNCSTSVHIPLRAQDPKIAKLIHFVWAGGKKLMPAENIAAVKSWAVAHQADDFEIWIWIDETFSPGTRAQYGAFGLPSAAPRIVLCDITALGVSSPHVRYEIDRLRSNYGASSDMLRYNILYRYGGAYFDSDVHPGARTLNHDGLFDDLRPGLFLVDNNSQGKGLIGNDAFICGAGNALMRAIATTAEEHYRNPFPECGCRVYNYDTPAYMQNSTILKTGPMAVSLALHGQGKLRAQPRTTDAAGKTIQLSIKEINRVATVNQVVDEHWMDNRYVRPEEQNQGNWMKVPIKKFDTLVPVVAIVVQTIRFEADYMGFLRLDSHIRDMAESVGLAFSESGEPLEHENQLAMELALGLRSAGVNLSAVPDAPRMSRFKALRKVCYQHGLIGIRDGMQIQATWPLGSQDGPRRMPGSLAMFEQWTVKIQPYNGVAMGIHFLENGILIAARAVAASGGRDVETRALVSALLSLSGKMDDLFMDNPDCFSAEDVCLEHTSTREFFEHLLYRLRERVQVLAAHVADPPPPSDQAPPALPPLPLAWRDCSFSELYID
jgi:mannosyltransferase OCH1-like enzyme